MSSVDVRLVDRLCSSRPGLRDRAERFTFLLYRFEAKMWSHPNAYAESCKIIAAKYRALPKAERRALRTMLALR
jgi:hypothetical protein